MSSGPEWCATCGQPATNYCRKIMRHNAEVARAAAAAADDATAIKAGIEAADCGMIARDNPFFTAMAELPDGFSLAELTRLSKLAGLWRGAFQDRQKANVDKAVATIRGATS